MLTVEGVLGARAGVDGQQRHAAERAVAGHAARPERRFADHPGRTHARVGLRYQVRVAVRVAVGRRRRRVEMVASTSASASTNSSFVGRHS